MSEKKTIVPKVFPTPSQNDVDKINADKLVQYEAAKIEVANEIYNGAVAPNDTPNGHISAVEIMRQRTANQLAQRENNGQFNGVVVDPSKAENAPIISASQARIDEQMRLRDEQLQKNLAQTNNYQKMEEEARTRHLQPPVTPVNVPPAYVPPTPPIQPPMTNNGFDNYDRNNNSANNYIQEISQAQFNSPFDVIPLPSEGKTYRGKRPNVRVSYMTTADENILSSPNLLQSGEFLEILINRKLLEQDLRYKDLLPGDRNAIMIWLRATGYGEMYPVTLLDENDTPFDTNINLDELKTKKLGATPDAEGYFDFMLPISKKRIKFKLLTIGEVEWIEKMVEADKAAGIPVNNSTTYTWERTIVEVEGDRNINNLKDFSQNLRVKDAEALTKYIEQINCGIELDITVGTPGGGSIETFLPLNLGFFWPNIKL